MKLEPMLSLGNWEFDKPCMIFRNYPTESKKFWYEITILYTTEEIRTTIASLHLVLRGARNGYNEPCFIRHELVKRGTLKECIDVAYKDYQTISVHIKEILI